MPLGDSYLELVTVVDDAEANRSAFGSWVARALPAVLRPLGWAVRTDRLGDSADRLGLAVEAGSRVTRDGRLVEWRLAGVDEAAAEPTLPFFTEWAEGTSLPGRTPVAHAAGPVAIARLELAGDPDRLAAWLGAHELPISVRAGAPSVETVVLAASADELTLSVL